MPQTMTEPNLNLPDFTAMWRDWVVKSEQQWSEAATQLLKDERAGSLLNKQVAEARMLHKQFSEVAQMSLAAANMPSKTDFEALDERLGRLEDGLAGMSAALVQLRQALVKSGAAPGVAPQPARYRKPAAKSLPEAAPSSASSAAPRAAASSKPRSKASPRGSTKA
jgi:hypothetical protein